jgi:hypothetical protein
MHVTSLKIYEHTPTCAQSYKQNNLSKEFWEECQYIIKILFDAEYLSWRVRTRYKVSVPQRGNQSRPTVFPFI